MAGHDSDQNVIRDAYAINPKLVGFIVPSMFSVLTNAILPMDVIRVDEWTVWGGFRISEKGVRRV